MADREKLSALMDGEVIDNALIAELERDQSSQESWKNFHLIGDVMRGEEPQSTNWDIASRVALALEDEPVHGQPKPVEVVTPMIESQPTPERARTLLPSWLTNLGQVGVAACVSLVVILGVQQTAGTDSQTESQLPVFPTVALNGSVEPVSLTQQAIAPQQSEVDIQEQRRRIHALLQDYDLQLRLKSDNLEQATETLETVVE